MIVKKSVIDHNNYNRHYQELLFYDMIQSILLSFINNYSSSPYLYAFFKFLLRVPTYVF